MSTTMSLESRLTGGWSRRHPHSDQGLEGHVQQTSGVESGGLTARAGELRLIGEFLSRAGNHGDCLLCRRRDVGQTNWTSCWGRQGEASEV
jgi:hypothetical protein